LTHTLIVRGFDDQVHKQLGEIANQKGVSINSIVRDAVDNWLKKQRSVVPRKHHLIIYSDDESILQTLKLIDRLAIEEKLFRCFFCPPDSLYTEYLLKLSWYNGTIEPYFYSPPTTNRIQSQRSVIKYCRKLIQNIVANASNKQICCMDFLMNEVKKVSPKEGLAIEREYNSNRIAGLMYCTYKTENLLDSKIEDLIELFEIHDQIFIVKNEEVYKLHITKENIHMLFLS
jgi:hypothetical protein